MDAETILATGIAIGNHRHLPDAILNSQYF